LYGKDLQYIRVGADGVVLKRGGIEILLRGEGVHSVIEALLPLLDRGHSREQVLESFPEDQRAEIDQLLSGLLQRRLITTDPEPPAEELSLNSLRSSFWWNFGDTSRDAPNRLAQAKFVVVGANLITRALLRSLLDTGVGHVTLVDHAVLNNEVAPVHLNSAAGQRLSRVPELPSEEDLADVSLLCAASDFGQSDALLEINRLALRLKKPFLPIWLGELVGYVGPLNHPYESACLRCFRARAESNNPDYEAARAVRRHTEENPQFRFSTGLLPPMAAILGEIAAAELVKFIAGFPPCDTVGRIIEINLVSFSSAVRRVLKIPRCPDCSEIMAKATKAITLGPLVPYSE